MWHISAACLWIDHCTKKTPTLVYVSFVKAYLNARKTNYMYAQVLRYTYAQSLVHKHWHHHSLSEIESNANTFDFCRLGVGLLIMSSISCVFFLLLDVWYWNKFDMIDMILKPSMVQHIFVIINQTSSTNLCLCIFIALISFYKCVKIM